MPKCVTCRRELHPERALKYDYCMARECQEKNAKGLTMVAVGVNKAAEQYMILDERTREELASGIYHDQRRGSFGPAARPPGRPAARPSSGGAPSASAPSGREPAPRQVPRAGHQTSRASRTTTRRPWSKSQEKLALLYNEQRLRPDEIAAKLGLSPYLVTQIILAARNQGKL